QGVPCPGGEVYRGIVGGVCPVGGLHSPLAHVFLTLQEQIVDSGGASLDLHAHEFARKLVILDVDVDFSSGKAVLETPETPRTEVIPPVPVRRRIASQDLDDLVPAL